MSWYMERRGLLLDELRRQGEITSRELAEVLGWEPKEALNKLKSLWAQELVIYHPSEDRSPGRWSAADA